MGIIKKIFISFRLLLIIFLLTILLYYFYPYDISESSASIFTYTKYYPEYNDSVVLSIPEYEEIQVSPYKFNLVIQDKYSAWLEFSQNFSYLSLFVQKIGEEEQIIVTVPNKGITRLATSGNIIATAIAEIGGNDEILIYNLETKDLERVKLPPRYKILGSNSPLIQVTQRSIFLIVAKQNPFKELILEYNLLTKEFKEFTYGRPCIIGSGPFISKIIYRDNYLHWKQSGEFCLSGGFYKKATKD